MIIDPIQGGRLGSIGRAPEPTVDDLLRAAVAEGGALGDTAQRLLDPKKSFFSTMTEATFKTLNGFIDTIQTPMYAVAGLLDPNMTIADAVRDKVSPGDVLMKDAPLKEDSFLSKAGYQITKFGVDTLLDPLTYVTFGASRGILGLSKGASAFAGEKLALELGKKQGMRVYVSEAGEDLANKYLTAQRNGLRQTFLKNERIKMVNKGLDNDEISRRLLDLDETTSDFMIKNILDSRLDKKQATQAVLNMLQNPRTKHLIPKMIDSGGIKFFGKSILSGQRIRAVKAVLPGMTALDKAIEPVRGKIGNMFSTNYVGGQRMTDEFIETEQKWKNIAEAHRDRLSINGSRIKKELNLTENEWELVTAAAEYGIRPGDKKIDDIYRLLHGEDPVNGTIREEVWKGLLAVKRMNARSRRQMIASGLGVANHPNYMPHLLVTEDVKNVPFRPSALQQTTNRTKFAKLSTLIDKNGVRTPVRMLAKPDKDGNVDILKIVDGKEVQETVKFIDASRELGKIEGVFKKQSQAITEQLSNLSQTIKGDRQFIKGAVATKLVDDVDRLLEDIPEILPQDKKLLADEITKLVGESDVDKIVQGRLSRFYKDGIKFTGGQSVSKVDLDKLALDIVMAKDEATSIVSRINQLLAKSPKLPHKGKAMPKQGVVDKEVAKLAKEMMEEAKEIKKATIARKLDANQVTDFLKQVVARTSKSPNGLNRVIDKIITNKQLATDLKAELSDIQRAFEIEKEEIIDGANKFIDETGKKMERIRISVDEAKKLGANFEDNALVASLLASDDAIKVSTARHFIREVAEKYGHPASKAPVGAVPIEKTGFQYEGQDVAKWMTDTKGEPLYFHPAIAQHIQEFTTGMASDTGSRDFLKAYDSLQNYFKAAVTSIFPAFHGRNALSNVFLMYNKIGYEALNPASHVAAMNILDLERQTRAFQRAKIKGGNTPKEMVELMSKIVLTDGTGYQWTWGELRKEIIDNVVAFHHKNLGQADQLRFGKSQVKEAAEKMFPTTRAGKLMQKTDPFNPLNTDNLLFRGGFKIGQTIEDHSRTLLFISHLKKVGDPIEAARMTKLALFDYSNLTKFEKNFMRRIIPFYSFSRKNLELQVETLLTQPGRIAQQIRAVQSLGDYFGQEELTEEEVAKLPDWARKGYNVVTNREGSHVTLLRTLGTPMEELFNRADSQENLSMISPLLKIPFEMASGYSVFHGKHISEVTQADAYQFAPEYIKKWIGYSEVGYTDKNGNKQTYHTSFAPWRMYTISQMQPIGRFFSEVNRIEKAPDSASKFNALMFGFGTRELDLEREEMKRIKENEEALQSLLEQGGIGYTFNRYVPEPTQELGDF